MEINKILRYIWVSLLIILLALLTVGCTSTGQTIGSSKTDTLTDSTVTVTLIPPTITDSPIPPSETATTNPPTLTDTFVPTSTQTSTKIPPSATSTEEPPRAKLFNNTVCRYGPGTVFSIHTYFEEDGSGWIRGRLDDDSWYLIELPESKDTCWIFNEIVEIDKTTSLMPVLTPPPRPTPAPVPTQSEEEKKLGVKYFLIIPDNGGPFACGDGMAYFYSGKNGKGIEDDITQALNALFQEKREYVGNYYNPVYQSSLSVKDVEFEDGNTTIWLSGKLTKPKSDCEAKRIRLQIWETASQFSEIKNRPIIFVNNALLGDLLENVKK